MTLTPTVRTLLTVLAAAVTVVGGLIASGELTDLPSWVGIVLAAVSATLGALGITPPQAGGVQQSVSNPRVVDE